MTTPEQTVSAPVNTPEAVGEFPEALQMIAGAIALSPRIYGGFVHPHEWPTIRAALDAAGADYAAVPWPQGWGVISTMPFPHHNLTEGVPTSAAILFIQMVQAANARTDLCANEIAASPFWGALVEWWIEEGSKSSDEAKSTAPSPSAAA